MFQSVVVGAQSDDYHLFLAAEFVVRISRIVVWMMFMPVCPQLSFDDRFYLIEACCSVFIDPSLAR